MRGYTHIATQDLESYRRRAVSLYQNGLTHDEIASELGVDISTSKRWWQRYRAEGLDGLKNRPLLGKPPRLTVEQVAQITATLHGQTLTLARIGDYIQDRYGVRLGKTRLWILATRHGWAQWGKS
jgi:transposase